MKTAKSYIIMLIILYSISLVTYNTTDNFYNPNILSKDIISTEIPESKPSETYQIYSDFTNQTSSRDNIINSGLLGGSNTDEGLMMETGLNGEIIIAGETTSPDFFSTIGLNKITEDGTLGGSTDIFLMSINPNNYSVNWATFHSGNSSVFTSNNIKGMKIDASGNIYIVGTTEQKDWPTTPGQDNFIDAGDELETFISKFNPNGTLEWSRLFGGDGLDIVYDLAIDPFGGIYITGSTDSINNFPIVNGKYPTQRPLYSNYEAFITRIHENGTITFSTTFGGYYNATDDTGGRAFGLAISVNYLGNPYVLGATNSKEFPIVGPAPFGKTYGGGFDGFIAEFPSTQDYNNGNTSGIIWSTFINGTLDDAFNDAYVYKAVLETNANNLIFAFESSSPDLDRYSMYNSPGSFYRNFTGGPTDVVIGKLSFNEGSYFTYLGGLNGASNEQRDRVWDIVWDETTNGFYIAGSTSSEDFPLRGSHSYTIDGSSNMYLTRFSENNSIIWSTIIETGTLTRIHGMTINPVSSDITVIGTTQQGGLTYPFKNNITSNYDGYDAYVMTFVSSNRPMKVDNINVKEGYSHVFIDWNETMGTDDVVIGYNIYRSTNQYDLNSFTLLSGTTNLYYNDTTVTNGINYYYKVAAVSLKYEGEMSTYKQAFPHGPPSIVQILSANLNDNYIYLNWSTPINDGGDPIWGYKIYRSTDGVNFTELAAPYQAEWIGNYYYDYTIVVGNQYYYSVAPINIYGEGKSNLITINPSDWPTSNSSSTLITSTSNTTITTSSTGTVTTITNSTSTVTTITSSTSTVTTTTSSTSTVTATTSPTSTVTTTTSSTSTVTTTTSPTSTVTTTTSSTGTIVTTINSTSPSINSSSQITSSPNSSPSAFLPFNIISFVLSLSMIIVINRKVRKII